MSAEAHQFRARLGRFVEPTPFEEYAERYREHVLLERRDGIVEFRIHSDGGPAILSFGARNAWVRALREVAADPDNEVLIITGTADAWVGGLDAASFATPMSDLPEDVLYDNIFGDTAKLLDTLVFGIDIPTIAVINGPGGHCEIGLLCDITLAAEDVVLSDRHFKLGVPPGDGIGLCFQALLGPKRAAYALYTAQGIDARRALELGMVNEVGPAEQLLERAWAIAREMLLVPRTARRLTHAIIQRPLRRLLSEDGGFGLTHEMYGVLAGKAMDGAAAVAALATPVEPPA